MWWGHGGPVGNIGGEKLPERIVAEPMVGHRMWYVASSGQGRGIILRSIFVNYDWLGVDQTAVCRTVYYPGTPPEHKPTESPHPKCSCGFYCQLDDTPFDEYRPMAAGRVIATGTVAMWGRIIKCTRGYKAQHVRIQSPITIDMTCYGGCENDVQRVELPVLGGSYGSWCWTDHKPSGLDVVTIEADIWLKEAKRELEDRYEGVEVLTWRM